MGKMGRQADNGAISFTLGKLDDVTHRCLGVFGRRLSDFLCDLVHLYPNSNAIRVTMVSFPWNESSSDTTID